MIIAILYVLLVIIVGTKLKSKLAFYSLICLVTLFYGRPIGLLVMLILAVLFIRRDKRG